MKRLVLVVFALLAGFGLVSCRNDSWNQKLTVVVETVRLQSFSESLGCFVTEDLVRFLFEFRQPRLGAATGVFGLSAS